MPRAGGLVPGTRGFVGSRHPGPRLAWALSHPCKGQHPLGIRKMKRRHSNRRGQLQPDKGLLRKAHSGQHAD